MLFRNNLLCFASLIMSTNGLYLENDFWTWFTGFFFFLFLLLLLFCFCCCRWWCLWFCYVIIIILIFNIFVIILCYFGIIFLGYSTFLFLFFVVHGDHYLIGLFLILISYLLTISLLNFSYSIIVMTILL